VAQELLWPGKFGSIFTMPACPVAQARALAKSLHVDSGADLHLSLRAFGKKKVQLEGSEKKAAN
jgi:hypothetical protein